MTNHSLRALALVLALASSSFVFTGCTRDISSSSYTESDVGEVSETLEGTVLKVRPVKVKGSDKLSGNTAGLATGAIAGGLLGYQFGKGKGNLAATGAGALLGAAAGAYAQDALTTQEGLEYTVKLTDGRLKTVVQGKDNAIAPGQRVLLYVYNSGRSRVVAF